MENLQGRELVMMPQFFSEQEKKEYLNKMFTVKGYYPALGTGGMGIDFVNNPQYISELTKRGVLPTMSAVLLALGEPENREILFGPKETRLEKNRVKFSREKNKEILIDRVAKMREKNPYGIVAINLMHAVGDYKEMIKTIGNLGTKNEKGEVVGNGVDILVVGAGMPRDLGVDILEYPHLRYMPIVSSAKAAKFMMIFAKKNNGRLPDGFYIEHPDVAGGHLGKKEIAESGFDAQKTIDEIRKYIAEYYDEDVHVPVVLGGGISYREDIDKALKIGYDSVNMGTRPLLTKESGLPNKLISAKYLVADDVDTTLKSPAGLPSNSVNNPEMVVEKNAKEIVKNCIKCIKSCKYLDAAKDALKQGKTNAETKSYCIADKLSLTRHGLDGGLLFSGKELRVIKNDSLYLDQETGKALIPTVKQMVEFVLNPKHKRPNN